METLTQKRRHSILFLKENRVTDMGPKIVAQIVEINKLTFLLVYSKHHLQTSFAVTTKHWPMFCFTEIQTALTRCRHILKTVKNVTVAKFELALTRYWNNLKTVGNLTVKNSLQDFDAKEMYLHSKNRSVSFQKH